MTREIPTLEFKRENRQENLYNNSSHLLSIYYEPCTMLYTLHALPYSYKMHTVTIPIL